MPVRRVTAGMSTQTQTDLKSPRALILLAVFLIVVIGVGAIIGVSTVPGEWYASLAKPPFNPPSWVFGPVWFTLYVLIAIAGWRTFLAEPNGLGMKLWYGQMALNWLWSPTWFSLHLLWPAFVVIIAIFALILAFIFNRWDRDRLSAWLFVPYAAWVGFASLLNLAIASLN
jgi:tryptophan-rich sensory protein